MLRNTVVTFLLASAGLLIPAAARAHFILQAPASWAEQGSLGDPQKSAPCGQADPGLTVVPTNTVTSFAPGQQITITINETFTHPGHYRVALSTTGQSGLPADPPVTPTAGDQCASTVIQNPPVFPVLADGMLPHDAAFSGPQTFTVTLPSNMTCTSNCVLQVIEYMRMHGAPCFYHHCANITIQAGGGTGGTTGAGGTSATGGAGGSGTGGSTGGSGSSSGGGCAVGTARASLLGVLLMLVVVAARRRRAR
jgi:hypothetical protein